MNLMTMILPLLCCASISLLVANTNPTFEGYRYEKPSIPFEYPAFTKLTTTNADIKPTPMKVATEKIATKSQIQKHEQQLNKPTTATMTATIQQQTQQEKSHKLEKIEKSTVINPTAIKETNLNIKSNKNPVTTAGTTTTIKTTEIKKDKLSLNQLYNTSSVSNIAATNTYSSPAGCSVYVPLQQQQKNHQNKFEENFTKTKTDLLTLAEQEAALENLLNRDNAYIYRVASNTNNSALYDNYLPHTQHNDHHATKRLRLKHDHEDHHNDHSIKYCCEQTFSFLKEKYTELSLKRPEDRRLNEYIESLKEKEYFD